MALEPGDSVPAELSVLDARGERVALATFHGRPMLLIFLRHLG